MKLGHKICFLLFFASVAANAQFSDNIWYFGPTNEGISFEGSSNQPFVLHNQHTPFGSEGCSVVTNPADGTLFYYTDGIRVVDKTHKAMPNGTGLSGHASSAQNGLSCPVPGKCNSYYIFSNSSAAEATPAGTIYYSIIDMTLPGNGTIANPLGDVQADAKNVTVISNTSEGATVINSSVKDEYWLISHQYNSGVIRVLKINSSGITLAGSYNLGYTVSDARSLRYSESSKKLCLLGLYSLDPVIICDFDNSTGVISNSSKMPGTPFFTTAMKYYGAYDAEWSSDGTKLYISVYRWSSTGGRLYQYDINEPLTLPLLIFNNGGTTSQVGRGLKKGPNGKIYWLYTNSTFNSTRYIGVVNEPNLSGDLCKFDPTGLDMENDLGNSHKFPDFLTYTNNNPVAENDYISAPHCITSTSVINVLANDSDPDNDNLTVSIVNVNLGSASVSHDNTVLYSAPQGYSGMDTLTYVISDDACPSLNDTAIAVLCVNNNCLNQPPVALNDTVSICLDGGMTQLVLPLDNDTDPEGDLLSFTIVNTGKGMAFDYSDSSFNYIAPYLVSGVDSITYIVCDESCNFICDSGYVFFCVNYQEILIPNLITPNNDRKNDTFEILGLYPNSSLEIYNRLGELTYSSKNYQNEWQGENCSDGIYYFNFSDPIREKQWKGWLQVLSKDL